MATANPRVGGLGRSRWFNRPVSAPAVIALSANSVHDLGIGLQIRPRGHARR